MSSSVRSSSRQEELTRKKTNGRVAIPTRYSAVLVFRSYLILRFSQGFGAISLSSDDVSWRILRLPLTHDPLPVDAREPFPHDLPIAHGCRRVLFPLVARLVRHIVVPRPDADADA